MKGLECCHKMGVLGLPNCDELECPYFKDRLSCWLDVLSDAIELMKEYEVLKDQNAKLIRQKQERFQPVRCKDCCNWKPPHILLNDGRQRLYRDGEKNDPLHIGVSMDVGINIGGKCWVDHNCGYGRDMRVFRKEGHESSLPYICNRLKDCS